MGRTINDHQFASVTALTAPERYKHFVRQVADWQQLWSLHNREGWVMLGTSEGEKCFPVWPHARYAEDFATAEFADTQTTSIVLDEWLTRLSPALASDGISIAVFPVTPCRSVIVAAHFLQTDLERELTHHE